MLTVVTLSHPGAVRPTNEDAVLWDADLGLLAIADGMGGHSAGEVASRMALDTLQASLSESCNLSRAAWPFGRVETLPAAANRLRTAVMLANAAVFRASRHHAEYAGMGTTLTAALIEGAQVWFASVGDSRLYVKRRGESPLQQLTRDDSVADLLAEGGAQPVTLLNMQMRHVLTNAIGPRSDLTVEPHPLELTAGDLLLMTTDGLHGPVGDHVIDVMLDGHETMKLDTVAAQLLEAALGAGGRDNITLALGRYDES